MNNTVVKSLILGFAIVVAVGGVLVFIKTIVSPPQNIRVENVHALDVLKLSDEYNPDSLELYEAEKVFDMIVDRASLYLGDSLIDPKTYDKAIIISTEKFSDSFISWSMSKFSMSTWNSNDHVVMKRIINKIKSMRVENGLMSALESTTQESLAIVEWVVNDYGKAWSLAKHTVFLPWNYADAKTKVNTAEEYAHHMYLSHCVSLVNALNQVGNNMENSCYLQLLQKVNRLNNRSNFSTKEEYDKESGYIYELIREFEQTDAFGVSTSEHSKKLKDLQDTYDKAAEYYYWPEER